MKSPTMKRLKVTGAMFIENLTVCFYYMEKKLNTSNL